VIHKIEKERQRERETEREREIKGYTLSVFIKNSNLTGSKSTVFEKSKNQNFEFFINTLSA